VKADFDKVRSRISGSEVRRALGRTERMNLLVTPSQKAEIRLAAERYGLSMTDYLLRLHALVEARTRQTALGNAKKS
jgi:hypothetical protein